MKPANRQAMVVKPKRPFFDWAASVRGPGPLVMPREDQDCTAYLLQEDWDDRSVHEFLRDNWRSFFEFELRSWEENETMWPHEITFEAFQKWFNVEVHSIVMDLLDGLYEC